MKMVMQNLLESIRPLVGLQGWDYCVLWKLSEDQSTMIELMHCCCGGVESSQNGGEEEHHFSVPPILTCRDTIFQHPRTHACDLLSQLPYSVPIDSGNIYGQTLVSNQPNWSHVSCSTDSSVLEEIVGTRVLVPMPGGLIELFVTKQVPEDQNVIDFITTEFNNISFLDNENEDHHQEATNQFQLPPEHCSDQIDDEDDVKNSSRPGQSKNLFAERKRRKKLNDRLYVLRSLVPNISKMDKASILRDAIEFVKDLQKQAKELQDELKSECDNDKVPNRFDIVGKSYNESVTKENKDSVTTNNDKAQQMEPQVEVAQINGNEFFVKVFCEHRPGGFIRLIEALNSLGLVVSNANVTRSTGLVSNVFKVEKRNSEVEVDHVRDSLLELTQNPPRVWPDMSKASENGCRFQ
ncbi:transcription factor ABORTED MICROSPORES [Ziziphus jujuba]|uniref:Transcription factor ABORTED MICROSPORES n=1 Tax=Ziziphus jujuba TaxID=326968 RepID=A0ABM3I1Y6_ZIZJJ|nr:transcription factor ABORTED MICROSPORES [Ziziphus jujuba]